MSDILEISRSGRVLTIRLNRPQKRNALSAELCLAAVRAIEDGERDNATGAMVLAANGAAFCAGMDLAEIRPDNPEEINRAHEQLFTLGARLSKPLIGAVEGAALGGGCGLVANCHIAIASGKATFGLTEIRLGLWPFLVFRAMTAAVGERRAVEMSLTGRIFGPAEAKEIGLIHEVAENAAGRAAEVAEGIAASSPTSIRAGMEFVRQVRGQGWREAGEIAAGIRTEVFRSADFREGLRAFHAKEPPKWPSLE
jgi:enoyl-CoA hydratase/carnithine racemase